MAGKKVLVADDSLTIQKVIKLALSNEGYEIKTVSDGNEAVQEISLFRPDVVLVDVSLPGKDAFEVKRAVTQDGSFENTRFILMSSAFEKIDEEQERACAFSGRLTKPFDPAHLRQLLTSVLSGLPKTEQRPAATMTRPTPQSGAGIPQRPGTFHRTEPQPDLAAPTNLDEPLAPPEGLVGSDSLWQDGPPPLPDEIEPTQTGILNRAALSTQPSPAPEPAAPPPTSSESDIRELTESTIRMSGLDDLGWNVDESVATKTPFATSAEPINPFSTPASDDDLMAPQDSEPGLPPASMLDDPSIEPPFNRRSSSELPIRGTPVGGDFTEARSPEIPSIDPARLEQIVRAQLNETLVQMAKTLLPEVAERVIKAEIRKLLSEQP